MTLGYVWECLSLDLLFHIFIQQILNGSLLHCVLSHLGPNTCEAGCSQEEGPKKGFLMGSGAQGVQEILEKCM